MTKLAEFKEYRKRMNKVILEKGNIVTKRFFNIDTKTYHEGALPVKIKELLG